MKKLLIFFILFFTLSVFAQTTYLKRELRGIWIATVSNIDWPNVTGTNSSTIQSQKSRLIEIMAAHKSINANVFYFQVRSVCDAMYKSSYEPWSAYLTGSQGTAPSDPNWDPLQFAIEEAHKRGMELHAWVNPFRALLSNGNVNNVHSSHVIKTHPEWIIKCSTSEYRFLDPGQPQVRAYIAKVFMDIVRRYDIDGLHMDDYFYAYSDYGTYNDDATYAAYPNGYSSGQRSDWRKNNIDLLIKLVNDSLQIIKPDVKWSISPMGNKPNNDGIYCDPYHWLNGTYRDTSGVNHDEDPYIDAMIPQLYYDNFQYYLDTYWSSSTMKGRHLYNGLGTYRISESTWDAQEIMDDIQTGRNRTHVGGHVHFSSQSIERQNLKGIKDSLINNSYKYKSIPPIMNWKDVIAPNVPQNLVFARIPGTSICNLIWDSPTAASDGDTAKKYVIYKFESSPSIPSDLDDPANIDDISKYRNHSPVMGSNPVGQYYFVVTSLDENNNESNMSNVATILAPDIPNLILPLADAQNQRDTIMFSWTFANNASNYQLQISTDSNFSTVAANYTDLVDTFKTVTGLIGLTEYFWRVRGYNVAGYGDYTDEWSFNTGFPLEPELIYPVSVSSVSRVPKFVWTSSSDTNSYHILVAKSANFNESSIIIDTLGIADTTFLSVDTLQSNTFYFWKVRSQNNFGFSNWTTYKQFKTGTSTDIKIDGILPRVFTLFQNYPNPFNPTTTIKYALPEASNVKITIYNILGQEVVKLVDEFKPAGIYQITWNAGNLSSGVYLYRITAGNYIEVKKLILMK